MDTPESPIDYITAADIFRTTSAYLELLNLHKEALNGRSRVLESGCGTGGLVLELLKQYPEVEVRALDINQGAIDLLNSNALPKYEARLWTYCQDAQDLAQPPAKFLDGYFDGVSSMLVLKFIENQDLYLGEHIRVMKQGGTFVISGPDEGVRTNIDDIIGKWETDLREKGVLNESTEEHWEVYKQRTRQNLVADDKGYRPQQLLQKLEEFGLSIISTKPNPVYYGSGYVIQTQKINK